MVFNHYATVSSQVQILNLTVFKRNPPNAFSKKRSNSFYVDERKKIVKIPFLVNLCIFMMTKKWFFMLILDSECCDG